MDYTEMQDGDMLQALGDDASKWAAAFCQIARKKGIELDEGWMIGWFANAIEHSSDVRRQTRAPVTGTSAQERARELLPSTLFASYAEWGAAVKNVAAALTEAERRCAEEMRDRAAQLVDHHPFADDATEGCVDAQGCCEMMAAQIRALSLDGCGPRRYWPRGSSPSQRDIST